jgi:hypothetical protein
MTDIASAKIEIITLRLLNKITSKKIIAENKLTSALQRRKYAWD